MKRLLAFFLALSLLRGAAFADHLSDLREWPANGLPAAAVWTVAGFPLQWHVAQTQAGHRLIPTNSLPARHKIGVPPAEAGRALMEELAACSPELQWISDNGLPLILRDVSQLAIRMVHDYRGGPEDATSPNEWRIKSDGVLDAKPLCDPLALPETWRVEGKAIAESQYIAELQRLCPNVAWAGLWDNAEAGYPNWNSYSDRFDAGRTHRLWASREKMAGISLRMRDRVDQIGYDTFVEEFLPEYWTRRQGQYQAMYDGLRENLGPWQGKRIVSVGYSGRLAGWVPPPHIMDQIGGSPSCWDGCGHQFYVGAAGRFDLLSYDFEGEVGWNLPGWRFNRARNPNAIRVLYLSILGNAALKAAELGIHEVIDPAVYQALCEWLYWLCREPGESSVLGEWWIGNATPHAQRFWDSADEQERLTALGREDLKDVTEGDYAIVPAKAADSICREAIKPYWLRGEAVDAVCSEPRVKLHVLRLHGQYLIYVWSPCKLEGTVSVQIPGEEPVTINAPQPSGYWVYQPPRAAVVTEILP